MHRRVGRVAGTCGLPIRSLFAPFRWGGGPAERCGFGVSQFGIYTHTKDFQSPERKHRDEMKAEAYVIKRRTARTTALGATCMRTGRQPRTLRTAMCVRKASGFCSRAVSGRTIETVHPRSPNSLSSRRLTLFPTELNRTEHQSIQFAENSRPEVSLAALNKGSLDNATQNLNYGFQHSTRYSDVFSLISALEETDCTSYLDHTCSTPTDCDFLGSLLKYTHIL